MTGQCCTHGIEYGLDFLEHACVHADREAA